MCEWKGVTCDQRESKGSSGLNGESGNETVCGGQEGSPLNERDQTDKEIFLNYLDDCLQRFWSECVYCGVR